jgi:hypothetical protein
MYIYGCVIYAPLWHTFIYTHICISIYIDMPIPVAERSKAWVCSRSPAENAGSNSTWGMDVCLFVCLFVVSVVCLSGRGLCDGLITRPEESYRLWCVIVCDLETSRLRRLKPASGL